MRAFVVIAFTLHSTFIFMDHASHRMHFYHAALLQNAVHVVAVPSVLTLMSPDKAA